jgi:hypothetical protein
MSTGTIFLIIILVAFAYFATQWGASRGPGSIQKDLLNAVAFIIVGVVLWFMLAGAHVAVVGR